MGKSKEKSLLQHPGFEDLQSRISYYEKLLDSTVEGLLLHKNGIAIDVNEPLQKLFGYSKEELIGKNLIELLPVDEDIDTVRENVSKGSSKPYHAKGKKKNGDVFYAEIQGKNIEIGDQSLRIASVRDITDKVEAQKALSESEQKFKVLVETLPDVVMVLDKNGQAIYANDQLSKQTGYKVEDIKFGKYDPFIYPADREIFDGNFKKLFNEEDTISSSFENRFVNANGEIVWYSTVLSLIIFKGNPAVQMVSRNITETKDYEQELKQHRSRLQELISERTKEINQLNKDLVHSNSELTKLNSEISRQNIDLKSILSQLKSTQRQLIDSEKLASVGKLTAGLAHELNNPVNWIGGVLRPLKLSLEEIKSMVPSEKQTDIFKEVDELFASIEQGTSKISDIIKTLSDITPKGSLEKKEKIDLAELVYSIIYTLESRYPEITFTVEIPDNVYLFATGVDIQQVFFNVIKNSADAVENMEGKISVSVSIESDNLKCEVSDNGPGIPEKIQQEIYEPFFTTREFGNNLGLGLYIVKSIVSKYNGTIFLESDDKNGTTFSFNIPGVVK